MTKLKYICFILAFTINVQIRATAIDIQEPRDCWIKEGECSLKNDDFAKTYSIDAGNLAVSPHGVWIRRSESEVRLLKGTFFINAQNSFYVQTKYARLKLEPDQSIIIQTEAHRTEIISFNGMIRVHDLNDEVYLLPTGYSNYWGKITHMQKVDLGFARPANIKKVIRVIGYMSQIDKKEIYIGLENFKKYWLLALNETQDRSVASANQIIEDWEVKKKQRAESLKKSQVERKKMRDFFFKKTFLE